MPDVSPRWQRRVATVVFIGLAIAFGTAVVVGGVNLLSPWTADGGGMGEDVCADAFGDEWTYKGYSTGGNPPTVHCDGPGGRLGIVDMPPAMQDEVGVEVANSSRGDGG